MIRGFANSIALLAAAFVIAAAQDARAGCVATLVKTETGSFTPKYVDFSNPQFVQIPQFNPASGQLCFVVVRVTGTFDMSIDVENNTLASPFITASATETLYMTPPAFMAPTLVPANHSEQIPQATQMVGPNDGGGAFTFTGADTAHFALSPNPTNFPLANNVMFNQLDPGFASFSGLGDYQFEFNGDGEYRIHSNAGSSNARVNMSISGLVEVEYHYVPEPSTALLLLAGIPLLRRRRSR